METIKRNVTQTHNQKKKITFRCALFFEVVKQTLKDILGDSAASATIYHLGGDKTLQDPKAFEKRLKALFGLGAETIMKAIQKNLQSHQEAMGMEKSLKQLLASSNSTGRTKAHYKATGHFSKLDCGRFKNTSYWKKSHQEM